MSEHAIDRYIERHSARHAGGELGRRWVAQHVAEESARAVLVECIPGDLNGDGQWIWRIDFLGPLLLVVDKTGLIRTVLP
jgi:hypothetical protein